MYQSHEYLTYLRIAKDIVDDDGVLWRSLGEVQQWMITDNDDEQQ